MIKITSFVKGITYLIFTLFLLLILIKTSDIEAKGFTFTFNGNGLYRILFGLSFFIIICSLLYINLSISI